MSRRIITFVADSNILKEMKLFVLCVLLLSSACTLAAKSVDDPVHVVDSLLADYSSASRSNKAAIADRLIKLCQADDNL